MQWLKSYREQNPGKTYLDWKAYAEGGETGDEERQRIEKLLGPRRDSLPPYQPQRNIIGGPLASGRISYVGDLEDAANLTPIGDVISLKDMYDASKEGDWLGVGLSALTMVPFVPTTVKEFRKKFKGVTPKTKQIPKVNKNATQDAIDAFTREYNRRAAIMAEHGELMRKGNNQGYNLVERLQDDPSYFQRAAEIKEKFGDDYTRVYADLIDTYNTNPEKFPKASVFDGKGRSKARMEADTKAKERHMAGGEFPRVDEWNYRIDPSYNNLTNYTTEHEWNHYVDFNQTKSPMADGSNIFKQMRKDLEGVKVDLNDAYYSNPTEQKAYMNQLREYMFEKGMINSRGQKVDTKTITTALKSIDDPNMRSIVRASEQFRNPRTYTRWFNQVPLLTIPALGMYQYFNQQNNNQYESNTTNLSNTEL